MGYSVKCIIYYVVDSVPIQGDNVGKGGIDVTPSDNREAPAPPEHLQHLVDSHGSPESLSKTPNGATSIAEKLLPRETGEDIGMGSPVPLSDEAVGVITRLRNMKVQNTFATNQEDLR